MIFLDCLQLLVGDSNFKTALPNEVTADEFAENVLGFEEVEEEGEEGDEEEDMEGMQEYDVDGVIPEEEQAAY
jgi:hypothetical protein